MPKTPAEKAEAKAIRERRAKFLQLVPMTPTDRRIELVEAWGASVGFVGNKGGWVKNQHGKSIGHGWTAVASQGHFQTRAIKWAMADIVPGWTFEELLRADRGYRPTFNADIDWRCVVLAQEYDRWQKMRQDPRRAFTIGWKFDGTDMFRMTVSDAFAWKGNRLLVGEPPDHWQERLEGWKEGRVSSLANWIGTFATGGYTVQERGSKVLVAFEHTADAVIFRLRAEQSPWKDKALTIKRPPKRGMAFLQAAA